MNWGKKSLGNAHQTGRDIAISTFATSVLTKPEKAQEDFYT